VVDQPLLSIVVTSYTMDRLKDVCELLDSIKVQTYPKTETVVVVERTTDLLDNAKRYVTEKAIPNTKIIFNQGENGLSAARNLGIKETTGDIVAFVDDDALLYPDWTEEIVKTYKDSSVIGATGPSLPKWETKSLDWVPEEFYWIIGGSIFNAQAEVHEVRNVSGTNMSFRRRAFERSGLFLTSLGAQEGGGGLGKQKFAGEETEFSIRVRRTLGMRILYNPQIKVWHKVYRYRVNTRFIARRAYSEGYTKAMLNKSRKQDSGDRLLAVEHRLLWRITTRLFPSILKGFLVSPRTSWRRLSLTVNAVFFVAVGYCSYALQSLFGHQEAVLEAEVKTSETRI
jgi:glucosyl-dolichyl phosphate glucuronosyltransferase